MAKKKSAYASEPAVPPKKIANTNPIPGPEVGKLSSPTVPERVGVIHGLGTPAHNFPARHVKGVHGYGHLPHQKHGHVRLSGVPKAHRLGYK